MKAIKTLGFGAAMLLLLFVTASFLLKRSVEKNDTMNNTGKGFAVIELFTSEGCSSCPPADRLIEQLGAQDQQGQLYILAYHVDYWDHQGWKDRFSDKSYTARQQEYARLLHVDPIYTPQLVVNGAGEFVGSDQRSISAAIGEQLQQDLPRKLKLNGVIDGKNLIISHNGEQNTKSELVVALVQKKAESRVKAGENMGRDLSHVQIVRDLKQVSLQNGSTAEIRLPKDFDNSSWEVIGFVQDKESGKITDATRFGW